MIFLLLGNSEKPSSESRTGAPEGQTIGPLKKKKNKHLVLTLISLCQTIHHTEHTQAVASLSGGVLSTSTPLHIYYEW